MKAVLTGATGFIGGAVARRLADEGVAVHALTRPGADRTRLAGRPIVFHDGDFTDPADLVGLFDGATWVIHAAGMLGRAGVSEAEYRRVNAEGARVFLAAAAEATRAGRTTADLRVLHVSTAGVLGPIRVEQADNLRYDECAAPAPSNAYERSKGCRWSSPGRSSSMAPATGTCWASSGPSSAASSSTLATAATPATRPTSMIWSMGCWPVCGWARRAGSTPSPGRGR